MRHTITPTTPEHGPSIVQPHFHWYIRQVEHFRVVSDECLFWKGVGAEPWMTLSAGLGKQATASVPPRTYHRFENASKTRPLVVDVQLDPEHYEGEQRFFRNFSGYLDDYRNSMMEPSPFQLCVFLHAAETPVALPLQNEWLGVIASRVFLHVMAFVGRWMLGYRASYPEYYDERKGR
ncbi:putative ankyrin repeat domain-containing protein 29 protein [Cladophialophora carrionii]|uniref:Putative ankyrin repeat domain-containing protein 29 protein n=1 Tax=Cladophialophora carrionii TaxID=86049 RepID=A0A1C1CC37_9EURO|nr:putative ankyrin repeat domain-containing protein 29 protein [Cladophialophora carrionii]